VGDGCEGGDEGDGDDESGQITIFLCVSLQQLDQPRFAFASAAAAAAAAASAAAAAAHSSLALPFYIIAWTAVDCCGGNSNSDSAATFLFSHRACMCLTDSTTGLQQIICHTTTPLQAQIVNKLKE
jgi:hypothetical protein